MREAVGHDRFVESVEGITDAIGVDEVNYCTSIAGDVVVAACWLPLPPTVDGVGDSKSLNSKLRLEVFTRICVEGKFAVVPVPACMCQLGMKALRDRAMATAVWMLVRTLGRTPKVLVDGPKDRKQTETIRSLVPEASVDQIVDGDARSYLIGAASIVAKVYVDALFEGWERFWPGYGLNRNHGMATKSHRKALSELGPGPVHRVGYGQRFWKCFGGGL